MDIARPQRLRVPRALYIGVALLIVGVAAVFGMNSLAHQTAGTTVDRSTVVTDVARRGNLVRSITAPGVFAPERLRVASATQAGVVDDVFVKPGSVVVPGTVIARMSNPAIDAQLEDARSSLRVAQANFDDARQQTQAAVITQQSNLSDARAQMQANELQAKSYADLQKRGLVANLTYEQYVIQAHKSENDVRNARAEVDVAAADAQAKLAAAQAQIDQAASQLAAVQAQDDALLVRAVSGGIVQTVDVDSGMSIAANTEIARIADMRDLKAVLQVAESDVHAVAIGMQAQIDTGNGVAIGRVTRIAPAAENGSVAVDVTFARSLPPGARPAANVTGTIVISTIRHALSIARPAGAPDQGEITLFKVVDGGSRAVRTRVRIGQGSSERVQVQSGLSAGDTVIVSDTSQYVDQTTLHLR